MESLRVDLSNAGGDARVILRPKSLSFEAKLPVERDAEVGWRRAKALQISARRQLLDRLEKRGLSERLIHGRDLRPESIKPSVTVCRTRAEHDLFSYCKLIQSVPSAPRAGRRIRLLVTDLGHPTEPLMGAVELASPVFTVGSRDRYLGWVGRSNADAKRRGLRRIMDLATCIAVPPYSRLRAGKLLAAIALSTVVEEEFSTRYDDDLVALIATCATGIHYPHLNRVTVRAGGVYCRIGTTVGYSTSMFSSGTLAAARELIAPGVPAQAFGAGHRKALPVLRAALRCCSLPEEPFLCAGIEKGVYFGSAYRYARDTLATGGPSHGRPISLRDAIQWWSRIPLRSALNRSGTRFALDSTGPPNPPDDRS